MKHYSGCLLRRLVRALWIAVLALFLLGAVALAQGGYDLTWWTVDGGGGTASGGGYELIGTAGQPDAGILGGGAFALSGGFWPSGVDLLNRTYLPLVLRS